MTYFDRTRGRAVGSIAPATPLPVMPRQVSRPLGCLNRNQASGQTVAARAAICAGFKMADFAAAISE